MMSFIITVLYTKEQRKYNMNNFHTLNLLKAFLIYSVLYSLSTNFCLISLPISSKDKFIVSSFSSFVSGLCSIIVALFLKKITTIIIERIIENSSKIMYFLKLLAISNS